MRWKVGLLLIIIFLGVMAFCSCSPQDRDNDFGGEENGEEPTIEPYVILDSLNFNSNYFNPLQPEQKGFILFDYINFNNIKFRIKPKRSPRYAIYYQDKLLKTFDKPIGATQYSRYLLEKTGEYEITVEGGSAIRESIFINVRAGGYPEKVLGSICDLQGNQVDLVQAGEQYQLKAEVYSDGELLLEDTELFSSNWFNGGESGHREHIFTAPNRIKDGDFVYSFDYDCFAGNDTWRRSSKFQIPIKHNHIGIRIDYGIYLKNSPTTLSSKERFNVDKNDPDTNFLLQVKTWHQFSNGDEQYVKFSIDSKRENDTVVAFVRYDEEEEPYRYERYKYNTKDELIYALTSIYQLNPKKNTAYIYFAYCYQEDAEIGIRYVYEKIENSDRTIHISD